VVHECALFGQIQIGDQSVQRTNMHNVTDGATRQAWGRRRREMIAGFPLTHGKHFARFFGFNLPSPVSNLFS